MTKTIDTLVEDIYSLFTSGNKTVLQEEDLACFLKDINVAVVSALSGDQHENKVRMSGIGKKDRKLWYELNTAQDKRLPLDGPTYIKFLYGNILEALLVLLTKASGHTITDQQKELEIEGVKGHTDGCVDGVVIDFKSASSFGFKKFVDGSIVTNDPFGYIAQISAYAKAQGKDEAAFIAIDKSNGDLAVSKVHAMDMINPNARIKKIKEVVSSAVPPERCYKPVPDGKSGNLGLDTGCSYCDFRFMCWSDANGGKGLRTFAYANGPKSFVHVEKMPQVEEIT
jgi:hypothetical protein